ncbi:Cas10/Cmr2 second palm domain-containing protein [Aeromicrobium duanguangcaii]|uniref:Cas10/Cmr2 second palm domain-containing protein n=1 Tax=Aeromicrobium duanguangcaii TaxID=2968086 RepID=UPI002017C2CB|nr:hypothetical protein [Aeromicrobium duanguangcaii]MCL3836881.1 hypothetical protein [Aeromicrobium duanguangcaii]
MALAFADIGATRIQSWLDRTSRLRQRRGGSHMINQLTSNDHVTSLLTGFPGVTINVAAGEIDGLVSLCADAPDVLAAKNLVRQAARHVVSAIQRELPTLGIEVTVGSGTSYHHAHAQMASKREAGDLDIDAPPAVAELPFVQACADCRVSPAASTKYNPDRLRVCAECHARSKRTVDETTILGDITEVEDFRGLAEPPRLTDIALIFADGNRVGAFKQALAAVQGRPDVPDIDEFSVMLNDANNNAIHQALDAVAPAKIIRHLAGGDDLLLSVEARSAWAFTQAYLGAFAGHWRTARGDSRFPGIDVAQLPTSSAAIVFHHYSHPFAEALALATELLKHAKKTHRGRTAAIGFSRVSSDGDAVTGDERPPAELAWLTAHGDALTSVATYPQAQRKMLRATLASTEPPETRRAALRKATEHGLRDLTALSSSTQPLSHDDELEAVAWVLDLTEWWT